MHLGVGHPVSSAITTVREQQGCASIVGRGDPRDREEAGGANVSHSLVRAREIDEARGRPTRYRTPGA